MNERQATQGLAAVDAGQPDDVQLPYLETFSKAAELSSFTGAAKALRLTQASVSQRVQALEKALGTPLFKREGGRVLLTESGKKALRLCGPNSRPSPRSAPANHWPRRPGGWRAVACRQFHPRGTLAPDLAVTFRSET